MVSLPLPPHSRSGPSVPRITAPWSPLGLGFEHTGRQSGFPPPAKPLRARRWALGFAALGSTDHRVFPRLNRMRAELFPPTETASGAHAGLASPWPFGGVSTILGVWGAPAGSNVMTASWPLGVT